jgi:hypothetical protein
VSGGRQAATRQNSEIQSVAALWNRRQISPSPGRPDVPHHGRLRRAGDAQVGGLVEVAMGDAAGRLPNRVEQRLAPPGRETGEAVSAGITGRMQGLASVAKETSGT